MGFAAVTKNDIVSQLRRVGVKRGDLLYVASFMAILGNRPRLLDDTIDALLETVGEQGTVIMPAFNWDYCRTLFFDHAETESKVGILTEAFRRRKGVLRNVAPPWCTFIAAGKHAATVASINGTSPFGPDSIVQYMIDRNVRQVLIGSTYADSVVFVHWLEQSFNVPYRYWKTFRGIVRINGKEVENVSEMFARRLDIDATIDSNHLTVVFDKTDKVQTAKLGRGKIRSFRVKDYIHFMTPYFEQDVLAVLSKESRKRLDAL